MTRSRTSKHGRDAQHSFAPFLTIAVRQFWSGLAVGNRDLPEHPRSFAGAPDTGTCRSSSGLERRGGRLWAAWIRHCSVTAELLCCVAVVVVSRAMLTWFLASTVAYAAGIPRVQDTITAWSGDAVYGRLSLAMIGNIQVRGIGDRLNVIFSFGSSVVGVQIVQLLVDLGMVMAGVACLILLRRTGGRLLNLAALWLAYAVGATMRLSWGNGSGGEMLLAMVATKLLGISSELFDAALRHGQAFSFALDLILAGCTAGAAAGGALVTARVFRRNASSVLNGRYPLGANKELLWAATALTFAAALVIPIVSFEPLSSPAVQFAANRGTPGGPLVSLPSVVTIVPAGDGRGWQYRVNGRPEIVHGIGYNAVTAGEPLDQRAAQYDRDFASISETGANTIVGWSEGEFDDLLMQKAAEHGLGVILPFHLGPTYVLSEPDYAYEDPSVRRQLLDAVSRRVEQYRNYPSLRMWGLGNEVLHAIAWAHGSPAHSQAFADFLVEAADRVHQEDPNHPVIYRDAEDWYVKPVIQALASKPKPRPWFVYGMNFFTTRLQSALDSGPVSRLAQPLMISEFGPVGLRSEARPAGYRGLWEIIRSHRDRVLGGSAYVWSTAGPEPLDRTFGLTDASGRPVDSSLAELASLYQAENGPLTSVLSEQGP